MGICQVLGIVMAIYPAIAAQNRLTVLGSSPVSHHLGHLAYEATETETKPRFESDLSDPLEADFELSRLQQAQPI